MNTRLPAAAALATALGSALAIGGALWFEHFRGLPPCPLCLEQRLPYYLAIPLGLVVAFAAHQNAPRRLIGLGLLALAGLMVWTGAIGLYHAGVEWHWWPGPQDCSGAMPQLRGGSLLEQIQRTRVIRCDEAAWRWAGISLAGWNVAIAAILAAIAVWAAVLTSRAAR